MYQVGTFGLGMKREGVATVSVGEDEGIVCEEVEVGEDEETAGEGDEETVYEGEVETASHVGVTQAAHCFGCGLY